MAQGYYMMSGNIAGAMVHVNVGTANTICALMNAARNNTPMFLASGRTPSTETGDAGSREAWIHWPQENFECPARESRGLAERPARDLASEANKTNRQQTSKQTNR
jgi:hypothetical protein